MDETIIIAVVGCGVLGAGLFAWIATRWSYRVRVTPMPVTVAHYETVEVAVTLERKRRLGLRWRAVAGTFIVKRGTEGRVAVSPALGSSSPEDAVFPLQVTGLQPGVDKIRLSATPAGRNTALVANVPVTITDDARGARRIRHTAAVLSDPGLPS